MPPSTEAPTTLPALPSLFSLFNFVGEDGRNETTRFNPLLSSSFTDNNRSRHTYASTPGIQRQQNFDTYAFGDNYFDVCNEEGGTAGTPSAFILQSQYGGDRVSQCFAYNTTYFHRALYNPRPFETKHSIAAMGVLAAMMGMGKTFLMAHLIEGTFRGRSVLSPTFRRALALTLADRDSFNLTCYISIERDANGPNLTDCGEYSWYHMLEFSLLRPPRRRV